MTACARMAAAVEPANEAIKGATADAPAALFDDTFFHDTAATEIYTRQRPAG